MISHYSRTNVSDKNVNSFKMTSVNLLGMYQTYFFNNLGWVQYTSSEL